MVYDVEFPAVAAIYMRYLFRYFDYLFLTCKEYNNVYMCVIHQLQDMFCKQEEEKMYVSNIHSISHRKYNIPFHPSFKNISLKKKFECKSINLYVYE